MQKAVSDKSGVEDEQDSHRKKTEISSFQVLLISWRQKETAQAPSYVKKDAESCVL